MYLPQFPKYNLVLKKQTWNFKCSVLLNINVINQIISYWFRYGSESAVLARGRRPWANTSDRGPVTGPIRNYLINDNFIDKLYF